MFKIKPAHHKSSAHSKHAADFCQTTVAAICHLHYRNDPITPLCPKRFVKRKLDSKKYMPIHNKYSWTFNCIMNFTGCIYNKFRSLENYHSSGMCLVGTKICKNCEVLKCWLSKYHVHHSSGIVMTSPRFWIQLTEALLILVIVINVALLRNSIVSMSGHGFLAKTVMMTQQWLAHSISGERKCCIWLVLFSFFFP